MRRLLSIAALVVAVVAVPSPARAQTSASGADARLRALYTEEWNWRRQEFGRTGDQPGEGGATDRLPRVDAASQQARLAYWTRALATLDAHPVRRAVGRRAGQRAGLPRVDPRARRRRALPHLRDAVQQRHLLLDVVHAAPGTGHRRCVSRLPGAPARRAALLRRADRQHARRAGARLHRAARLGGRARPDDRALRQGRHDQPAVSRRSRRCRRRSPPPTRRRCAPRPRR